MKIAFLGLGTMGGPMAAHLNTAGYALSAYNRSPARRDAWATRFGLGDRLAAGPIAAVEGADIVFTCLGADRDVLDMCLGDDGIFAAMKPGSVFVDHTTISAEAARQLYDAAKARGIAALDAPVSGGQAGAENARLTVMAGGDREAFERAGPVMASFAAKMTYIGPAGAGQTAKMANQICIAGTLQGLAEAMNLIRGAGLDSAVVVDAISGGAAQSWQMDNRAETMARGDYDFGFAVEWMRKDLAIALNEARRLGLSLPITALVDQFYGEVEAMGGARQDTSSLLRRFTDR